LAEFALVFPFFILILFAVIVYGLTIFYDQQVTNVAREAARYAAVNGVEAQCPTISHDPPQAPPFSYYPCDPPATGWPKMQAAARSYAFGVAGSAIHISACWSSYHDAANPDTTYDFPPEDALGNPNPFVQCKYAKVATNPSLLPCPAPPTTAADDEGSSLPNNHVSVYACMNWQPPMAGFLLIPQQVTLRSVITEVIHYQQR
jgi:hypothetical protein